MQTLESYLAELRETRDSLVSQLTSPAFMKAISIVATQAKPKVCGCGEPLLKHISGVIICPNCLV